MTASLANKGIIVLGLTIQNLQVYVTRAIFVLEVLLIPSKTLLLQVITLKKAQASPFNVL